MKDDLAKHKHKSKRPKKKCNGVDPPIIFRSNAQRYDAIIAKGCDIWWLIAGEKKLILYSKG